ncbi:MAG: hypothetical protein ACOY5F_20950 [Pseudomonadota bacterium]
MRGLGVAVAAALCVSMGSAMADLRITRDHGGEVEKYKAKYRRIAERGERVIIDGICNSACTLVIGIVPHNKICVTPRASLGFHQAYTVVEWPVRKKVAHAAGTRDLLSYYSEPVLDWIDRNGGLTPEMKVVKNGPELWNMLLPCPEEW